MIDAADVFLRLGEVFSIRGDRLAPLFCGALGAAGQARRHGKNNGAVAIAHVPFGALEVVGRGSLAKGVTRRDGPVLGEAASWAPAAVREICSEREVERGAVGTGLATADERDGRMRIGSG